MGLESREKSDHLPDVVFLRLAPRKAVEGLQNLLLSLAVGLKPSLATNVVEVVPPAHKPRDATGQLLHARVLQLGEMSNILELVILKVVLDKLHSEKGGLLAFTLPVKSDSFKNSCDPLGGRGENEKGQRASLPLTFQVFSPRVSAPCGQGGW